MRYFSMFSGIGGFELGIQKATNGEWGCVGYSEIEKTAIKTYKKRFPEHKNYGDATKINPNELPEFEILCAGFPCQSFSVAGKRMGFEDTRGTLFFEIARIAKGRQPQILFLENVKGLLSHDNGRTFATILTTLDELGYNVEWQCLNSKHFGIPQNRERVFIIGHLRGKSGRQIFPLRKEIPKGVGELPSKDISHREKQREAKSYPNIARTITATQREDARNTNFIMALRSYPRSGTKEVDGDRFQNVEINKEGISNTLTGVEKDNLVISRIQWDVSGKGYNSQQDRAYFSDGVMCCLPNANQDNKVNIIHNSKIRRLTPIECERLQGFPDNWTIGSDTQRYKQCGNAVTVNVIESITLEIKNSLEGVYSTETHNNCYAVRDKPSPKVLATPKPIA